MPASSNVVTAAGSQFAISATLPATHDLEGFEALTFINIAEVVDGGGSAGKSFNKVDHSPLGKREVLSLKGSFTQGTRSIVLGRDISDPGQQELIEALDSDDAYAFKITYQNGDVTYFTATVDSYTDDISTIDTIVGSTVAVALCNPIIRALDDGVVTASVNDGGTYTGDDGDYEATQASTSGSGTGAKFTVTVAAGAVTAVASVDFSGGGYVVADTITLAIPGLTETTAAVLDVDSIVG